MGATVTQLVPLWQEVLGLSNVRAGETLAILTGASSNPLYVDACTHAAQALGARVFRLDLPPVPGGRDPRGPEGRAVSARRHRERPALAEGRRP